MTYDRLVSDQYRRQRLWATPPSVPIEAVRQHHEILAENVVREVALTVAAEQIARPQPSLEVRMANTGARGLAAMMKARAEKMRAEFDKLGTAIGAEMDAQDMLLQHGHKQHEEMKRDTAELREALGMSNDPTGELSKSPFQDQ